MRHVKKGKSYSPEEIQARFMARYPEPSLHYCRTEAMGKNHRAPDKEINARALGILRIHRASVAKWTAEEPARLTAQLIDRCALAHADMTSTNDEQHTRQYWAVRNVLEKRGADGARQA